MRRRAELGWVLVWFTVKTGTLRQDDGGATAGSTRAQTGWNYLCQTLKITNSEENSEPERPTVVSVSIHCHNNEQLQREFITWTWTWREKPCRLLNNKYKQNRCTAQFHRRPRVHLFGSDCPSCVRRTDWSLPPSFPLLHFLQQLQSCCVHWFHFE